MLLGNDIYIIYSYVALSKSTCIDIALPCIKTNMSL